MESTDNASGYIQLYHSDSTYGLYSANMWDGNGNETYTMIGHTSSSSGDEAWTTLVLGTYSATHSQGRLRLFSTDSNTTDIVS